MWKFRLQAPSWGKCTKSCHARIDVVKKAYLVFVFSLLLSTGQLGLQVARWGGSTLETSLISSFKSGTHLFWIPFWEAFWGACIGERQSQYNIVSLMEIPVNLSYVLIKESLMAWEKKIFSCGLKSVARGRFRGLTRTHRHLMCTLSGHIVALF